MSLILLPIGFSIFYVTVLTALVAPTKDYNNISSILTEIHPVAWSKKQPQLGRPSPIAHGASEAIGYGAACGNALCEAISPTKLSKVTKIDQFDLI
jgi:hypothetical protein